MDFKAVFDLPGYAERPDIVPKGKITRHPASAEEASAIVNTYLEENWQLISRSARGALKYPYMVPGSVYDSLWDWDGFFIAAGAPDAAKDFVIGTALNLIDTPLENGRPIKMSSPEGDLSYYTHPYPLRAQFLYLCLKRFGCDEIVTLERVEKICRTLDFYESETTDSEGFFCWLAMSGIDNNPAVYGRNPGETSGADLMSFHYREYLALAELAAMHGIDAAPYRKKAAAVREKLCRCHRDERDGFFYDINRPKDPIVRKQLINWIDRIPYRGCSGVFPLWAQAAEPEMVKQAWQIFADENEFMTPWGIRTLSRREPMYNNELGANPSNWQGPVWSLPNALLVYALAAAGMKAEAADLASRLVKLLASDILSNGCMHEYYNAETGEPVLKPGFISWHMLAYRLCEKVENGESPF